MDTIGRNKYAFLKSVKEKLTPEDQKKVQEYEKQHAVIIPDAEKTKEYLEKLRNLSIEPVYDFSTKKMLSEFKRNFKNQNGKEFLLNPDSHKNLAPLLYYFSKNEKFFSCENLIREIDFGGKVKFSEPSFDKGCLVIGGYGNGKTAIMKTFHRMFRKIKEKSFSSTTANDVIDAYESCKTQDDKDQFWIKMKSGKKYFDDLKTERTANNYGKVNIFKELIEKRYDSGALTFFTCNYKDEYQGDLAQALLEFGEMYGNRAFDRLFEMFNIIVFTGNSMRR
ncbi:hypothetical protein [Epilithonimonas sp. UC225_85]|uniref:hypothetical protein n=1 Tax=Epilithonimonas sp. UC225_85 TaxID=3350167 RepID=UPI0036D30501